MTPYTVHTELSKMAWEMMDAAPGPRDDYALAVHQRWQAHILADPALYAELHRRARGRG